MVSFRESLRSLFYFSRVCGLAPISINFKDITEISTSKFGTIYSVLVGIAYGSFHVISSLFNLNEQDDSNIITSVINYYNRYSRLALFWICILNAIVNQRRIVRAIRLIENVDKLFASELNCRTNNVKFSRVVLLEIVIYLIATGALEWNNCLMYISGIGVYNNYCMTMCLIPLIVANADQIFFINLVYLVKERLAIITKYLQQGTHLKKVPKIAEAHKIKGHVLKTVNMLYHFEHEAESIKVKMVQSRNAKGYIKTLSLGYSRLYEATILLNDAYGIPNVCTVFIRFVALTTLAYSSCIRLLNLKNLDDTDNLMGHDERRATKVPGIVGWILLNFIEMVIFCFVCHQVKEEGQYVGAHLQCFRVENTHSDEVDTMIDAFSRQIHHQRVEIRPCGFFIVDLTLIFSLIATVTTYIMILIQFDISQMPRHQVQ
ncbi:putative gustatory receptor 2a [Phlebotomus argentipes]|uniref:putative gustatory receptor 2a n=1 Tax=Phlebotomus argentipes TaxID=94469 RepID=UPI002892AD8A|nr:putative gustatory receptor 2a [Phlebotomus argentipes]